MQFQWPGLGVSVSTTMVRLVTFGLLALGIMSLLSCVVMKKLVRSVAKKHATEANAEFKKKGLAYAAAPPSSSGGLRGLQQTSFSELCTWRDDRCCRYLMEKEVLD